MMIITTRHALAMGLVAVFSIALGWFANGYFEQPLATSANLTLSNARGAFAFYSEEPDYPVEFTTERQEQFSSWAEKALGRHVEPVDLRESGYEYIGGRLLPEAGGRAVMFLYQNDEGRRVSLFCWRARDGAPSQVAERGEDSGQILDHVWYRNGIGYAFFGLGDTPRFDELASAARAQYESAD